MAGTFTAILIDVQSEAEAGSLVEIAIHIQNIAYSNLFIMCAVRVDDEYLSVTPNEAWWTPAGWTAVFTTSFTMPDRDVLITAESIVEGEPPEWIIDDVAYRTVTGVAPPQYYTLDVVVEPSEAGYVTRSPVDIEYISGTRVTLTAKAYPGYQFVGWSGDASDTSPTVYITMNSNKVVYASFEPVPVVPEPEFRGLVVSEYTKR